MYHTQEIQFLTHKHFIVTGNIAYKKTTHSKTKSDNKMVEFYLEKYNEHKYHLKIENKKRNNTHHIVFDRTLSSWNEVTQALNRYV